MEKGIAGRVYSINIDVLKEALTELESKCSELRKIVSIAEASKGGASQDWEPLSPCRLCKAKRSPQCHTTCQDFRIHFREKEAQKRLLENLIALPEFYSNWHILHTMRSRLDL